MTKSITSAVFVPSTGNVAFAASIVQTLDGLAAKRKTWESTDFKKANDGLYALLAECQDTFSNKFVNATDSDRKTLRIELTTLLQAAGVKVQKNSTTLNMFVRYVFGSDRKRAHGYAYVLAAAISHGIKAEDFAAWVNQSGGIEEIKRKMIQKPESIERKQQVDNAKQSIATEVTLAEVAPLARFELAGLTGERAVLLAKPNPDGSVSIVGVLPEVNEALFNALFLRMARQRVNAGQLDAQLNAERDSLAKLAA